MSKVAFVLEGGSMRGLYSAGVLDILMDNKIEVDGIIGTSAGALFGPNYITKQRGRVIRYNKENCKNRGYISFWSFIFTGNIVNKKYAYYKIPMELDKFDNELFMKENKEFIVTATNIETGQADYISVKDTYKEIEAFRATSAVPIVTKPVKYAGKTYLDGGISDSIPVKKALELGYDKVIVILTQPKTYTKKPLSDKKKKFIHFKFKKYPKLIERMENRHKEYNETIEYINELERKGKIFVIRPSETLDIKLIERNPEEMERIYQIGIKDAKKKVKDLKKYLFKI